MENIQGSTEDLDSGSEQELGPDLGSGSGEEEMIGSAQIKTINKDFYTIAPGVFPTG